MAPAQLCFPASQVAKIAALDGVKAAAGSLTLSAIDDQGQGPRARLPGPAGAALRRRPATAAASAGGSAPVDVDSMSVTGVDPSQAGRSPPRRGSTPATPARRWSTWPTPSGTASRSASGHARRQAVQRSSGSALAAGRRGVGHLHRARPAADGVRPRGAREHRAGARRLERRRRRRREAIKGTLTGASVTTARRPRRPRRRLAGRRQEPRRQARHRADHRRARRGVPDRLAAHARLA